MNAFNKPLSGLPFGREVTSPSNAALQVHILVLGQDRGKDNAIRFSKDEVTLFERNLGLSATAFAFLRHIHEIGSFDLAAPVKKSDVRAAVSEINMEARKVIGMPDGFLLLKPQGQRLVISKASLDDIQKKIAKDKKAQKAAEQAAPQVAIIKPPTPQELARKIWAPILEKVNGSIAEYEHENKYLRKKYPNGWGSTPKKVGEHLVSLIHQMMNEGLETLRGMSDQACKDFCARASGHADWAAITDRPTKLQLLAARTALTYYDNGASPQSASYELNGTYVSPQAVMGLRMG